jgi:hypothetical protein
VGEFIDDNIVPEIDIEHDNFSRNIFGVEISSGFSK